MKRRRLFTSLLAGLAFTLALTSCGGINISLGGYDDDDDNGGDNTHEVLKSKNDIRTALGDNYSITMKWAMSADGDGEATTITTIRVGDDEYTETKVGEDVSGYLIHDGMVYGALDSENGKYEAVQAYTKDMYLGTTDAVDWLLGQYEKDMYYDTKTSGTTAGRSVNIYKYKEEITALTLKYSINYEYHVDKQTGLVLKYKIGYEGSTITESATASISYEVTEMKVGGVSLNDKIALIGITDWPTAADFAKVGASDVAKVDGTFILGDARYSSNEGAGFLDYEYRYQIANKDKFDALVTALYNAGFNSDYDGEKPQSELVYSPYTGSYKFYGRSTGGAATVEINESFSGDEYTLVLELYNSAGDI